MKKVPEILYPMWCAFKNELIRKLFLSSAWNDATGGYVIAVPNGGNVEYLKDRENCLLYDAGNIEKAKLLLQELQENRVLQESIIRKTVKNGAKSENGRILKIIF